LKLKSTWTILQAPHLFFMDYYPRHHGQHRFLSKLASHFKQLSISQRFTGGGAFLILVASLFVPWLQVDNHNYFSFQNITYLFGCLVILGGLFSFLLGLFEFLQWKKMRLPFPEGKIHLVIGISTIVLALLTLSVYNSLYLFTSQAEVKSGVLLAISGGILLILGSYFSTIENKRASVQKSMLVYSEDDHRLFQCLEKKEEEKGVPPSKEQTKLF